MLDFVEVVVLCRIICKSWKDMCFKFDDVVNFNGFWSKIFGVLFVLYVSLSREEIIFEFVSYIEFELIWIGVVVGI